MKKTRILTLALCLLFLLGLLTGCGASMMDSYNGGDKEPAAEENVLSGSQTDSGGGNGVLADRKLIRRIQVEAETEDMDILLEDVNSRITQLGGYIESRDIRNGSKYSDRRYRYATLVIRLPAQSLDTFLQQVSDTTNVVSTVEESDDVTLQYAATESRLTVLRTEEERLLQFLSEAAGVSEMLEIEKRLTDVQSEIESITTQLNTYDNLVDYGTITLSITEVEVYTEVKDEEPTMWEQIASGFTQSVRTLLQIGKALVVAILANSPYLILIAVIVVVILLIVRLCTRRHRRRPPMPPVPPMQPGVPPVRMEEKDTDNSF